MKGESCLTINNLSFSYPGSGITLFEKINFTLQKGWNGISGANGSGKTTLLLLMTQHLGPQGGTVFIPGPSLYCPQRTDSLPEGHEEFREAPDGNAMKVKGLLGIRDEWFNRWDTLSHGERKRLQVGLALWKSPGVLAVDEPTNHLDVFTKKMIYDSLKTYNGIGILVSHDRELMDSLCAHCLFLRPGAVRLRPGGLTRGLEQETLEIEYNRKQKDRLNAEIKRLEKESARSREEARRSAGRLSGRKLNRKDKDGRGKLRRARLTGKDAVPGKTVNRIKSRLIQKNKSIDSLTVAAKRKTGISVPGSISSKDYLFKTGSMEISLGGGKILGVPEIMITPSDRIALTGGNGSGKSTLIERIMNSGLLRTAEYLYIPQEISLEETEALCKKLHSLNNADLASVLATISRLGSEPERIIEAGTLSPGEARKVLLSIGLLRNPALIVLDEPTNHMDIMSIICLERALSECRCALLLASHDVRFLNRLTTSRWNIAEDPGVPGRYVLSMGLAV
ncbi:MAG: ABC-F family ATP-binding cassette domain-containing protein [Spirochaetales bacterium]|nr:ABC-F family ATP-binding cassette domain-containing protein [Spirochaetales bacterium]